MGKFLIVSLAWGIQYITLFLLLRSMDCMDSENVLATLFLCSSFQTFFVFGIGAFLQQRQLIEVMIVMGTASACFYPSLPLWFIVLLILLDTALYMFFRYRVVAGLCAACAMFGIVLPVRLLAAGVVQDVGIAALCGAIFYFVGFALVPYASKLRHEEFWGISHRP